MTVPPVAEFAGGVKVDGDAEHAIIASWNNIKQKSRFPDESLRNYEIVVTGRRSEGYGVDFLLKAPPNSPVGTVVMGGGWGCEIEGSSFRVKLCIATQ